MDYAEQTGLRPIFEDMGAKLTVFAPTDEAFEQLPAELVDDDRNRALLRAVLLQHVAPKRLMLSEMPGDYLPSSLPHQPIRFLDDDTIAGSFDDQATIIRPDRETDHAMVQVIDGVLMPHFTLPTMLLHYDFKLFHAMLVQSGHLEAVSDPNTLMTIVAVSDKDIHAFGLELDEIQTGMGGMVRSIVENHTILGANEEKAEEMRTLSQLWVRREGDALTFSSGAQLEIEATGKASNGLIWSTSGVVDQLSANN
jgi:hypothetical protein